jgi:predicted secreted Zn-dependent protease
MVPPIQLEKYTPVWRVAKTCQGGSCVRVANTGRAILIGDTKSPDGDVLTYTVSEWREFVAGVKHGDFDDLLLGNR